MHVVVCFVIPPLFLPWQLDFASPRSHYCMNVTECFVFPSLLLSLQMAFASPRSHYCTNCTVWFVSPSPFMCLQMAFASLYPAIVCLSSVACSLFHALRGATRPTFKAFWTSEGPKCPQNGLKMGPFHPFVHPKWSRMRFGKMRF